MKKFLSSLIIGVFFVSQVIMADENPNKVKLGVVGLTHTHVHWIFESEKRGDFEIVGIVEPNSELARRYSAQHGFSMEIVYTELAEMLAKKTPEGVTAFGTIYEHLAVVETAAPLGVHVMVEKPLAVNLDHARKMQTLAAKHNIHLLTNYETTWYPSNHKAYDIVSKGEIGPLRKVVIHDGHKGPTKLGINKEFLDWLTDPKLNGGGAITDFGCYGANLMTWLMKGKRPTSVTAVTQQFQPENNPKVDDEATIILTYPKTQAIIQASWNWPFARKDMEIYGLTGTVHADNRTTIRLRKNENSEEIAIELDPLPYPHDDPFSLFGAVIRGKQTLAQDDLSGLDNNMVVMEILDAAIRSAKTGRTVMMD